MLVSALALRTLVYCLTPPPFYCGYQPATSNARSTTPVPDSNNNSNNSSPKQEGQKGGDTAAQASSTAVESGGGGARGNRASPTASGGLGFGFELGLGEVDPERQAMFQAQDANSTPVLWVKVR